MSQAMSGTGAGRAAGAAAGGGWRAALRGGLGTPLLLLTMLAMLVLPLPAPVLDVLFTFNIALSLLVLLAAVYTERPLHFATFPTVLLVATLLRLSLNIASTRVVLLEGHTGTDAAGRVIQAFGEFVVGGSYAVGMVVFAILVIINFVVVTKGAGRVSEVSARFTLDAMPGKQMAIDADLNAGIIGQEEAKARREEIAREADFYGAMDGASKFVRGDAVAGILILLINILGGLAVGVLQHEMPLAEAGRTYVLLTIGDGLVAQIPSLLLSTAAAIMVTRVSGEQPMGQAVAGQLLASPQPLAVTGAVLAVLGLVPGMPNLVFLGLGSAAGVGAWLLARRRAAAAAQEPEPKPETPPQSQPEGGELGWEELEPVDPIGLEVGYRLIPLVDREQGGALLARIRGVRRKLTQELGFLIPSVHIRDNLELPPNGYRITLLGVPMGEGEVHPQKELAINPGQVYGELEGIPTRDPAFGLPAVWIDPSRREEAQGLGYTVVDASTVVATHLSKIVQEHAHELLGREEVQRLLEQLARISPKLAEELVPKLLPASVVQQVLRNLLAERVPIRDLRTIAETLAAHAPHSQDPAELTARVRVALGRAIVQGINGMREELPVITLDPALEQLLQNSLQAGDGQAVVEPGLAEKLHQALQEAVRRQEAQGEPAVLLVSPALRPTLARFARHGLGTLHVLAYNELPESKRLRVVATVGG